MTGTIARIALRYLAGALVAYGLIGIEAGDQIANDPDLAIILGTAIAAGVEAAYALAKKRGWRT